MTIPEAKIERDLYYLLRTVLQRHDFRLNGMDFGNIQPQHSVDGGIADLVLPFADGKHFLVIECKRKISKPSGLKALRDFDVYGSNVINQALNYAVRLGTHAFATTNGSRFALFRTPQAGEPFRIDTHRLLIQDPFRLQEKNVEAILSFLAKWYADPLAVDLVQVDWFFISRLRSFVDFLSKPLVSAITKLESDKLFKKRYDEFSSNLGALTRQQLARQTAYLLMNKVIFYKILERHYKDLPELKPLLAPDGRYFMKFLRGYFDKAIEVTGDFEPIFVTEFYDEIPLPDLDYVFEEVNSFIEEMGNYKLEEVGSDVVGYIYEELIPEGEKHILGQFYTPPSIAELIVNWVVKSHKDVVLDPAVGSGTFLVKTYGRLKELKSEHYKKTKAQRGSSDIHKEIISQLYADDLNPFPAHLTSMNLAMRDVRYPTSEMNIIVEDFFNLRSKMKVFAPYVLKTPKGEIRREFIIPPFDSIVANPPYTRWVEIPERTQKSIRRSIGDMMKDYGLSGGIGKETGIYIHFIIHGYEFLKKNGRMGMIISNNWLQTVYGKNFANFLFDRFQIKAIIDFNQRLFRIPLIATCVILLQKEKNKKARNENKTVFVYLDKEAKVGEILDSIENPDRWKDKFRISVLRQGDIPRNEKMLKTMFGAGRIEKKIKNSPFITELSDLFDVSFANITGVFARGGTGGDKFFYLSKDDAEHRGLVPDHVCPAIVSSRHVKTFMFTELDWKRLRNNHKACYVFISHKPRSELPLNVREFIEWGEKTPLLKVRAGEKPRTPRDSTASTMRSRSREFFGWYDLGEVLRTPLFTSRRAQYRHRFVFLDIARCSLDDGFITLKPKKRIRREELHAMCSYLNSDFPSMLIEIYGRSTGGGVIELDDKSAGKLPVLNYKQLSKEHIAELAVLFEKLEMGTRKAGGAETEEELEKLQPFYAKINAKVAEILDFDHEFLEEVKQIRKILSERRIARIEIAKPESLKGKEQPKMTPPKKRRRKEKEELHKPLTRWMDSKRIK